MRRPSAATLAALSDRAWVEDAVMEIPGLKSCAVDLVFDPPWDPSRMSDEAKLQLNMF